MRSKEITSIEALNRHLAMGWKLVRAFETGMGVKFLMAKDNEEDTNDKRCKNDSGVQNT